MDNMDNMLIVPTFQVSAVPDPSSTIRTRALSCTEPGLLCAVPEVGWGADDSAWLPRFDVFAKPGLPLHLA